MSYNPAYPYSGQGKKLIKPEKKSFDIVSATITDTAVMPITISNTTGTPVCLNVMNAGSGFWQRIGNKVNLASVQIRGYFSRSANNQLEPVGIRVMVVYDRQSNGSTPNLNGDVLQAQVANGTGVSTDPYYLPINMNNRGRFIIVMDKTYSLPCSSALVANNDASNLVVEEYRKLKGMETVYKASTNPGSPGDISQGGLWFYVVANQASGVIGYTFSGTIRTRYYDV